MATLKNTTITETSAGFLRIPSGSGPQRPSPATAGTTRYNTDILHQLAHRHSVCQLV